METKTYNGWTNYETWAVKLWIDNEEGSYRYWRDETLFTWKHAETAGTFSRSESARYALANALRTYYHAVQPDLGGSVWGDLLGAALSEVDWPEIANSLLEDNEGYESEPEQAATD